MAVKKGERESAENNSASSMLADHQLLRMTKLTAG